MIKRRKILMIQTQLGYGGAETSFIRLANFLAQSMDVTVALFSTKGTYDAGHEPLHAPTVILDEKNRGTYPTRWLRRIKKLHALKQQHDVTISFLSGPNLVNVLAGTNTRSIVSLRGSRFYDPVAPKLKKFLFQYLCDPIIFRLAGRIVPVSDGLKYEIRRVANESTLAKVRIISPFIEEEALATALATPTPAPYDALKGQNVIVGVGRLSVEKGFHHLIRVFAALSKIQPGSKLLLVGNGPMESVLRAQCTRLGLAMDDTTPNVTSVLFAGYQSNVLPFMKVGSIYAMTSATEGFPNVVLEAMAASLPVIAADTPWGVRSILCKTPPSTSNPYPTATATQAEYGMLMPRIDLPEHERIWAEAFAAALTNPPPAHPERAHDFTLARVGENWKKLIHELS